MNKPMLTHDRELPQNISIHYQHGEMLFSKMCTVTGGLYEFRVLYTDFREWAQGMKLIQYAMPDLSDSQRELLMSGYTPAEWDAEWKED